MNMIGLLLDGITAVLLVITIGYCWLLNRRIRVLQDGKSELAKVLAHFDESTNQASESILALQTASKKMGDNMQLRIEKASYVLDDLGYLIEKGNKLADRMDAALAVNRARSRAMEPEARAPQVIDDGDDDGELLRAPVIEAPARPQTQRARASASLENVLERVTGRKAPADEPRPQPTISRSKAEEELLAMIKAGMKG